MSGDYRKYPFRKDPCPPGWVETTVGDILLELQNGFSSSKHNREALGIPHLRPMNVSPEGEIIMEDVQYIPQSAGSLRLAEGDILFTNTSSTVWVGKTAVVFKPGDWAFSNHMTRLRVADGISPEFVARQLHYLCMSGYFAFQCKKHINQSSVAAVQLSDKVPFRLPPSSEQKRIIAKLGRLLTRERGLHKDLSMLPALIQEYRAAVLQDACTGILVPTEAELAQRDRRNYEPASILLERILKKRRAIWEANELAEMHKLSKKRKNDKWKERYLEPQPPNAEGLFALPKDWVWASVEQCGFVQLGRQRSPENRSKRFPHSYIRAANITETGLDLTDVLEMDFPPREFDRYRLESGDILLSEASGSPEQVGKPAIWRGEISKCCFQNTVIRLKPIVLTSEFLLILLKHLYWVRAFAAIAGGAGINHLSAKKFSRMPIPLPPLAEQRRIVAEVKRQLAVISSIETTVKKALKETAQLRMLLFRKAFAGRLVPQNLHDESVSSLLDYARNAQATHTEQFQKERRNRMKKARATQAGLSSETVLPLIKKTFGRKRFTFIQLAPITPGDYETLKIEIFRLLSEMNGSRLKQIFNHSNKHIELKLVS